MTFDDHCDQENNQDMCAAEAAETVEVQESSGEDWEEACFKGRLLSVGVFLAGASKQFTAMKP